MRNFILATVSSLALVACGGQEPDASPEAATETAAASGSEHGYETRGSNNLADTMASDDARYMADGATPDSDAANDIPDATERPVMQAQVVLDRIGFGPGVIDGKMGMSTENALRGFQEANDLEVTGRLDQPTKTALAEWERIPATRVVTVPDSWAEAEYADMPDSVAGKAKLDRLGYKSLDERLAERFHTTVEVLRELNPGGRPAGSSASADAGPDDGANAQAADGQAGGGYFVAGQQLRVPNIGSRRGRSPMPTGSARWPRSASAPNRPRSTGSSSARRARRSRPIAGTSWWRCSPSARDRASSRFRWANGISSAKPTTRPTATIPKCSAMVTAKPIRLPRGPTRQWASCGST